MRNPFIELFHPFNNLQMARDCCNADTKCLRHLSNTLTGILLNNRTQLLVLDTTQTSSTLPKRPLPSSSLRLSSPLRNFLNHLRTVRSLVDSSPHAQLILAEASEALCPSLNSCNISRRRSCFVMFIMEGFYPSKLCSV
ncbi:hypothetical protein FHG87_015832 [Trinorchestia longiramus]|nr:hypothetical protein FHG87_015832 [Trinorchestia longiramus]